MKARFPTSTIAKAQDLRRILAKGEGLSLEDFDRKTHSDLAAKSLRDLAIRENAPPAVHRLLDEIGEAYVDVDSASRLGAYAIDHGKYHGLCEINREHPEDMKGWVNSPPAVAAQKIMYRYLEGKYHPAQTEKMLRLATSLGADWSIYRNTVHTHSKKHIEKFERMVVEMQAYAMETTSPAANAQAPRLRL